MCDYKAHTSYPSHVIFMPCSSCCTGLSLIINLFLLRLLRNIANVVNLNDI